ncbi:MAG: ABC transporter ATP-binding protein, partial [Candidatus Korarchaeota archaeon]
MEGEWNMGQVDVISYDHVTKRYGRVLAVNDLTASVRKGSITGIIGRNGAGKTTIIRMTLGLLRPTLGKITVLGEKPYANSKILKKIGYVADEPLPWRWLSPEGIVTGLLKISGIKDPVKKAHEALEKVGIREQRSISTFSKGMMQRVKIAIAIARDPELIIMDEPLNGLDPAARLQMMELFTELSREGKTLLISSNVLFEVDRICTDILLIERGYAVACGERDKISKLLMSFQHRVIIKTRERQRLASLLLSRNDITGIN